MEVDKIMRDAEKENRIFPHILQIVEIREIYGLHI